ncbi:MAG: acyltransferase [Methanobrevibacter sp.]|nr:acyltransferase [Methanobrevibacter sp.]
MKTKKERIFYYDFLRAFAIIAVLICHVDFFFGSLDTPIKIISQMTFHDIGRIGVPIFLMISGALLLNRKYELGDFLKRRFARIIYPFIFWIILISAQILYLNGSYTKVWNTFIGNPSITWYFWTLIGIYLFIPVINTFIEKYGLKGCEYFLAIWFATIILKTFSSYPLFPDFNLDYFAGYIGYPVLGYYLNNREFNLTDKKMCILGLITLILSLGVFVYLDYNNINYISLIYQNIPMVFMGAGMFVFIKYLDSITSFRHVKDNIIGKAIISISLCSYGMYFSHVIVLKFLAPFNPKSNLLFPVMFALTVFLSWLLPYIFSKIPYIKTFSGV